MWKISFPRFKITQRERQHPFTCLSNAMLISTACPAHVTLCSSRSLCWRSANCTSMPKIRVFQKFLGMDILEVHMQACISHHVLLFSFENWPVFLLWYLSDTIIHFFCSVFNFNYCHWNYPTTFSSTHLLQTSYLHDFLSPLLLLIESSYLLMHQGGTHCFCVDWVMFQGVSAREFAKLPIWVCTKCDFI